MTYRIEFDRPLAQTGVVRQLNERFRQWRLRRAAYDQTYYELSQMTDRDLMDIGIHRAEIPAVARRAALEA